MIEIQRRGYLLLPLFQSSADPSDAETIRAVLGDTQLAGVIRETTSAESFASTLLGNLGIPVVAMSMINTDDHQGAHALVRIDECAGVQEILDHSAQTSGKQHAVFLAGPNTNHSRQQPLEATFGKRFHHVDASGLGRLNRLSSSFTLALGEQRNRPYCSCR